MKLALSALGLWAASAAVAICAMFGAIVLAGNTVSGGERSVVALIAVDLCIAGAAIVLFWRFSRNMAGLTRGLATAGFAGVELLILAASVAIALLALNR